MAPSRDVERKALALTGSGDIIFDWDVAADRVYVSPEVEAQLGLPRGALEGPASDWLDVLHPLRARPLPRLPRHDARTKRAAASTRISGCAPPMAIISGFCLKARPVVGADGEVMRIVGTLSRHHREQDREERLLHDAVHDNLTGLPNRELFFDRLDAALTMAQSDPQIRPTVICIDIDRFKQINEAIGLSAGDSILLTIARRLSRLLKPQDTLARLSGDQFAAVIVSETETEQIIALRQCRAPRVCDAGDLQRQARSRSPPRSASRSSIRNCTPSARTC